MSPAAPPVSPLSVGGLTQLTLSLLVILALIFAASWALRRLKMTGTRGRGDLAVLDQLAVGPRERILLVRAGETQILIGVCPGGMVDLKPLPVPIVAGEQSRGASGAGLDTGAFAARLREFMHPRGRG